MKHFIRMQFQFHLHIGVQTNISWAFLLSAIPRYIQHRLILGSADIEQFFGRESIDVSKNFHQEEIRILQFYIGVDCIKEKSKRVNDCDFIQFNQGYARMGLFIFVQGDRGPFFIFTPMVCVKLCFCYHYNWLCRPFTTGTINN